MVSHSTIEDRKKLIASEVTTQIIGRGHFFETPFGSRELVYADYTATGRSINSIETFIRESVLPLYGNTHTTTSVTGRQSTEFREEARNIVADAVNAQIHGANSTDVVLFTDSGTTRAINTLVALLGLKQLHRRFLLDRPVVFIGPYEHHSNILPWRESNAEIVHVRLTDSGEIDITNLRRKLSQYARRSLKIGAFSAASNVTGVIPDVDAITCLLHQHDALAFWDYATAAPYVDINMNPSEEDGGSSLSYKDAIYFSGHKFVGGPGSPGVLIAKRHIFREESSTLPGGGTVLYVTDMDHHYLSNATEREEGGTPDIIGSIRLSLAFIIKQSIGSDIIMRLENALAENVRDSLSAHPRIVILGQQQSHQLPIFSFLIRCGDRFLHHNFVTSLLNDLFGVQVRGGCACAGPYVAQLLGLTENTLSGYVKAIKDNIGVLKPGFTRLSITYFMDEVEVQYILQAIHFVADHGWKFLSQYRYDVMSGDWSCISRFVAPQSRPFTTFMQRDISVQITKAIDDELDLASLRDENFILALSYVENCTDKSRPIHSREFKAFDSKYAALRWFANPDEGHHLTMMEQELDFDQISTNLLHPNRSKSAMRQRYTMAESYFERKSNSMMENKHWKDYIDVFKLSQERKSPHKNRYSKRKSVRYARSSIDDIEVSLESLDMRKSWFQRFSGQHKQTTWDKIKTKERRIFTSPGKFTVCR